MYNHFCLLYDDSENGENVTHEAHELYEKKGKMKLAQNLRSLPLVAQQGSLEKQAP